MDNSLRKTRVVLVFGDLSSLSMRKDVSEGSIKNTSVMGRRSDSKIKAYSTVDQDSFSVDKPVSN